MPECPALQYRQSVFASAAEDCAMRRFFPIRIGTILGCRGNKRYIDALAGNLPGITGHIDDPLPKDGSEVLNLQPMARRPSHRLGTCRQQELHCASLLAQCLATEEGGIDSKGEK